MTARTEVMIAGGGPVGLTLGLALARHGIDCRIAERNPGPTRIPKMDVTNCRSMELFRMLGVAGRLRAAGVPEGNNMDVSWVTSMSGHELHRFRYPCVPEARRRIRARNDGTQPLEPNMRISQVVLEPLLRDIARERGVRLDYGHAVEGFVQDADGVRTAVRADDGAAREIRSRYLVGCDGGGSLVRRALGIGLDGEAAARARYMVHFRSRDRAVLQRWGVAWHYQSPRYGTVICQDDREIWTLQAILPDGVAPEDADPRALLARFLGTGIECEILQANHWLGHLLVAEAYGDGRVFLAGDAAHQYIPTGGYGMNTGVGDAIDIAWKLAAVIRGWGGERLPASYEAERRPVGLRNRAASAEHTRTRLRVGALWSPAIEDPGPDGERARAEAASGIAALGNAENESLGIEIGYRYDGSPVIAPDPGAPPPLDPLVHHGGSWPGARAPSVFLADGRAILDLLAEGFTLVAFVEADLAGLVDAARRAGLPLTLLRLDDAGARAAWERDLVLVRPDQHVAWRGNAPPADPRAIVDLVRGA